MDFSTLAEEPLKNAIREAYFKGFLCTGDKIDFQISLPTKDLFDKEPTPLLWAEAKAGTYDLNKALTQLILTILKHKYESLPPFLAAFNGVSFAAIESEKLEPLLKELAKKTYKVVPSNHSSKEFKEVQELLNPLLNAHLITFHYEQHQCELKNFIKSLGTDTKTLQTQITRDNFKKIFDKWLICVQPSINLDWEQASKVNILEADFYLADLLAKHNHTILELSTLLMGDHYEFNQKVNPLTKALNFDKTGFNDHQEAHREFWRAYKRPPAEEYHHKITNRRDMLIGKREYRGAFYTPRMWADKSQDYLARLLGEDFQDNYFIWDLCAGTGNLLVGLSNPYKVYASTIDPSDVKIMQAKSKAPQEDFYIPLDHIFRFDFLEDPFSQLPPSLQEILKDPAQLSKLIIYINPPYAEAGNKSQMSGTGKNKDEVALSKMAKTYAKELGKAKNEVFAQFFMRIVKEIAGGIAEEQDNEIQSKETPSEETLRVSAQPKEAPLAGEKPSAFLIHQDFKPQKRDLDVQYGLRASIGFFDHDELLNGGFAPSRGRINSTNSPLKIRGPLLCAFSKLKYLNSSNFKTFRQHFKAHFLGGFMCPGNTFDHVKGSFPIGFLMWDLGAQG
ncbi:class I SAM-dependent methyltransferase [Helicobacter heilmannii]|uniref:Uncharacterized protein n=2 Tax=Helicobacter heilmannii TaxID=35817 RepID=A0A0K2Y809_HELHE|nr:class I SAM-dependent methyltransferase [Helicobacter heilmannii]CRI35306.1 hypothetical protein HHE01_03040 [Helicobacter heilmannii]